jgi:AcrR family transcriptional regulator
MKENSLSRDEWLNEALEVLREEGIQGVRVERLARDLNVTKGSFYWHFKSREDLQRAMLDHWKSSYTDAVVDNPDFRNGDAAAALLAAMKMVREHRLDEYELAFRAWADHDPIADRVARDVYARRHEFVDGLFKRIGFRGLDAEIRTRLMLCYMSWEPNMYADESERRRLQFLNLQHELLTRK